MHYHHEEKNVDTGQAAGYVVHTLLNNLKQWKSQSGDPVRAIGITHPVLLEASLNPPRFKYSPDIREQEELFRQATGFNNMGPGSSPMPMPMGSEATPEKESNIIEIRQTRFRLQFVWQPVPKEERQVNDIIMSVVAPKRAEYNPNFGELNAKPKLEVPLSEIETLVAEANKTITEQNEANKLLPLGDPDRKLNQELLKVTQEQYDAFKNRFLVPGTPEQKPQALKATAQPAGGDASAAM
jgi:hypothetical protein